MAFDTWVQQTTYAAFPEKKGPRAVSHKGLIYLTGGDPTGGGAKYNDVWRSYDGITWESVTTSAEWVGRSVHGFLSDGEDLYIFGGSTSAGPVLNDFWRSQDDGETWQQLNSACDWTARHEFGFAYINEKIYIYGGYAGGPNYRNDVWSVSTSSDASLSGSWTELLAQNNSPGVNQFSKRREMAYCVHNNKIWCLGGDAGVYYNDVWYSEDGVTWTSTTSAAEWSERREHAAFSYDDKLWIVAGNKSAGGATNETWYTSAATDGNTPWVQFTPSSDYTARLDTAALFHNNGVYIIAGET